MHQQGIVSSIWGHAIFSTLINLLSFLSSEILFAKDFWHLSHSLPWSTIFSIHNQQCNFEFLGHLLLPLTPVANPSLQIFWTVDAMDAKFCLKGKVLNPLSDTGFRSCELAGNFPAEEPDPDAALNIPIDFLVCSWFSSIRKPFPLKFTLVFFCPGIEGQPCCATGDHCFYFVYKMLQPHFQWKLMLRQCFYWPDKIRSLCFILFAGKFWAVIEQPCNYPGQQGKRRSHVRINDSE